MTDLRRSNLPVAEPTETPYVGLVPYQEEDADFFFGRDREIRIVTSNLRAHRLTILYGPSGAGKTSLLRAGVVHELHKELTRASAQPDQAPFAVCTIAAWRDDPLLTLMSAAQDAACEALGRSGEARWQPGTSVVRSLGAWTRRVRTLLIVLDQFEDYFLYHPDETGEGTFAGELPAIVNEPNLRVNFLVSVREDAWAKLDRFKGSIPRVFANYVRVDHLSREARRGRDTATDRGMEPPTPARRDALQRRDALVDSGDRRRCRWRARSGSGRCPRRMQASGVARHVEAPFLQLVMERLWRATVEAGSHDMTVARLEQLGGAQRIVENHLLEALGTLDPKEQAIAADAFFFLVTRSRTKIAHSASDLAEWTKRPERKSLPSSTSSAAPTADAFFGRSPRLAPRQPATSSSTICSRSQSSSGARAFEQERARRAAIRKFARIGGVLLALAASSAASEYGRWSSGARRRGDEVGNVARSRLGRDEKQLERASAVSLLLGLEAYRASPSPQAASAMTEALEAARRSGADAILRGDQGGVRAIALSPDGVGRLRPATSSGRSGSGTFGRACRWASPLRGHTERDLERRLQPGRADARICEPRRDRAAVERERRKGDRNRLSPRRRSSDRASPSAPTGGRSRSAATEAGSSSGTCRVAGRSVDRLRGHRPHRGPGVQSRRANARVPGS